MKILFHHRVASRDGQAVHIEELIHALRTQGHEVRVAAPAGWDQTGFGASNPVIDRIKRAIPASMYELLELAYNLTAFLRLRRAVARALIGHLLAQLLYVPLGRRQPLHKLAAHHLGDVVALLAQPRRHRPHLL